jgi:hypothetical protein
MPKENIDLQDGELEEEIAGILSAISIVSKRLSQRLRTLNESEKGGSYGTNESVRHGD